MPSKRTGPKGRAAHNETKGVKSPGSRKKTKKGTEKRSRITALTTGLGFILAAENVYLTTTGALKPNQIAEVRVALFLSQYYFPAAIADPISAMNRWGTDDFQDLHRARGLESYKAWYRPVRAIPSNLVTVTRSGDADDLFTIRVERILISGGRDHSIIQMRLKCSNWWQSHLPGVSCSPQNLRLDFTAVTEDRV